MLATSLQVNVLSPGLLAFLLLPLMLKTAKAYPQTVPRITVVSSGFHIYTKLDADIIGTDTPLALMNEKEYSTRVFATGADVSHVTSTVEFKFMLERRYGDVKSMIYMGCSLHFHSLLVFQCSIFSSLVNFKGCCRIGLR